VALPHTDNDTEAELDDAGERLAEIFGDNGTLLPIRMLTQPTQSYDTNVNDLAFFSSQAAQFAPGLYSYFGLLKYSIFIATISP
jgi:hypothetical protein